MKKKNKKGKNRYYNTATATGKKASRKKQKKQQPVVVEEQEIQPETKKYPETDKDWSGYCAVGGAIFCGLGAIFGILYYLCRVYTVGFGAALFTLVGLFNFARRRKKKFLQNMGKQFVYDIALFILIIFVILAKPARLDSTDIERYTGYRVYLDGLLDTEVLFPYVLPETIIPETFKIYSSNNTWGKSTWSSVRFCVETDSAQWKKMVLEKYARRIDECEGTLEDCLNGNSKSEDLRFLCDRDFWKGHEKDSYVMVDLNSGTDKKPLCKAIIINTKEGMVEFTQLNTPLFT